MSPELEQLIALHEIDKQLNEYILQFATFAQECEEIELNYKKYSSDVLLLQNNLIAAQKLFRQLEIDLQEAQQHHEKYKDDLMKVRNQKEYETVLREIDTVKKSISQLETQVLEALDQIKKHEEALEAFSPNIEGKRLEADSLIAECRSRQLAYEQDMELIRSKRTAIESLLSKNLLDTYNRVKLRTGQALSEVINGACSVCRMSLRPQIYAEVRAGNNIFTCDYCSRILYYIPEIKTEVAEVSSV